LALGAVAAVLIAPRTAWVAREQIAYVLPVVQPNRLVVLFNDSPLQRQTAATAAKHPEDIDMALASTLYIEAPAVHGGPDRYVGTAVMEKAEIHQADGQLMALRDVMRRFPKSAAARAAFLRIAANALVTLQGVASPAAHEGPRPHLLPSDSAINSPTILADFLQVAQEGARIEPDNAFFPTMTSLVHFLRGEGKPGCNDLFPPGPRGIHAAYADLDRAAHLSRWDDHAVELIRGLWRLSAEGFGMRDSVTRRNAIETLPSLYQSMNDLGNHIDFEILAEERSGHPEVGVALRARLSRIAALIGKQHLAYVNFGEMSALFNAATVGKIMHNGGVSSLDLDAYVGRLRTQHFNAEADWIKRADRSETELNDLNRPETQALMLEATNRTQILWLGGWFWLLQCVPFLLIGGFLAVRRYQRRFDRNPPRPLSADTVRGNILGFVTVIALETFAYQMNVQAGSLAALSPLIAVLLLVLVVVVVTVLRRAWLMAQAYALTMLCLVGLGLVTTWTLSGTVSFLVIQTKLQVLQKMVVLSATGWQLLQGGIAFTAFLLVVPACIALALMIVNRIVRVPVAAGVARGFGMLTLPCVTLLLLSYVGTTICLAGAETMVNRAQEAVIRPGG
jgi:hypothetical protein